MNQPNKTKHKIHLVSVIIGGMLTAWLIIALINRAAPGTLGAQKQPQFGSDTIHPTHVNASPDTPSLKTGLHPITQEPITASCNTCHQSRDAQLNNKTLDEFHQHVKFNHSNLSCYSCHNQNDYQTLKLASGESIPFSQTQRLCAQCHNPQATAFEHGAHGGMTGFWDKSRGPQYKNSCTDCHKPHSPQFPKMHPTFKPVDRFLDPTTHQTHSSKGTDHE